VEFHQYLEIGNQISDRTFLATYGVVEKKKPDKTVYVVKNWTLLWSLNQFFKV
jgi:hypothetical protein